MGILRCLCCDFESPSYSSPKPNIIPNTTTKDSRTSPIPPVLTNPSYLSPKSNNIANTSTKAEDLRFSPLLSSDFLSHLSDHPNTPTRELLKPYLAYELSLRKAFAQEGTRLDGLANLVPIYDGHESLFRIRTIDRETGDGMKYMMSLPDVRREVNGAPAIVASLNDYRRNFNAFTHGALAGIDWSNVVAAGSSALLPLLSRRKDVSIRDDPAVEDSLETYFQVVASSSDIDLFLYGLDSEDAAIQRILELEAVVRKNQRLAFGAGTALRTGNAITFISPKYPYRHVQIILRLYRSISEILTGFDVDCACVAFDGKQVYSNPRAITAIATRTNTIDLSRRSPSYENRLYKYRSHNFEVYWDSLERSRINADDFGPDSDPTTFTGLSRLIFLENILQEHRDAYRRKRLLKTIDESGEPALTSLSGYASHEIPYGEKFTAAMVRNYVTKHSGEPFLFGTIHEVVEQGTKPTNKNKEKLTGKVTFIKDNPGRQMIGSFYPLATDDWTKVAYRDNKSD